MKNRVRLAAVALAAAVPVASSAGVANAHDDYYGGGDEVVGQEGCTPGYWKNHLGAWQHLSPSTALSSVSGATAGTRFAAMRMSDGLSLRGGSGIDGARQILLRAGTAAVLDAAHGTADYSLTRAAVVSRVDAALRTGSRQAMLDTAAVLDRANNLGCPL